MWAILTSMPSSSLTIHDVDALARQAADLLTTDAHLSIEETSRSNPYVYPDATGGDRGRWRITVRLGPNNSAVLGLDPATAPATALGQLITELAEACDHQFRGRAFPPCTGPGHPADVVVEERTVVLACPNGSHADVTLVPSVPPA